MASSKRDEDLDMEKGDDFQFNCNSLNIFNQHKSACWFQAVIAAIFLNNKLKDYVWNHLFYYQDGIKYPIGCNFDKIVITGGDNPIEQKIVAQIILEYIRMSIQIMYERIKNNPDMPTLHRQDSLNMIEKMLGTTLPQVNKIDGIDMGFVKIWGGDPAKFLQYVKKEYWF